MALEFNCCGETELGAVGVRRQRKWMSAGFSFWSRGIQDGELVEVPFSFDSARAQ
jgi:hypothetical protein